MGPAGLRGDPGGEVSIGRSPLKLLSLNCCYIGQSVVRNLFFSSDEGISRCTRRPWGRRPSRTGCKY